MNYYIVVEGSVEKEVYAKWIPLINPSLNQIHSLGETTEDTFIIFNGGGYPSILGMIEDAIADLTISEKDYRLVVVIDSEEMTRQEKFDEINTYIKSNTVGLKHRL